MKKGKRFVGAGAPAFSIIRRRPADRIMVFVREVACATCKRACAVSENGWAHCEACEVGWKA